VRAASEKHGLTMAEVALRWISHHSLMKRDKGDTVIVGASNVDQLEQNLVDLEKGPLRELSACRKERAWRLMYA
jgi:aflatoxin B1 aldehyde reductase